MLVLLAALALQTPAAPAPAAQAAPAGETRIALSTSPALDFYFHVRSVATAGGKTTVEGFGPAVDAARELDKTLGGSFLAWGPLEGLLLGCQTAADIQRAFAAAPATIELRPGTSVPLREGALKLAAALVAAEPAFREPWQRREPRIQEARARWEAQVGPKEKELLAFHIHGLTMPDPHVSVPVVLVLEAPFPGAVTHRGADGKGVCFVAVGNAPGSQLHEMILHEVTHALDLASVNDSALGELRFLLLGNGVAQTDKLVRDLPHLLMFVQSAESIRRVIDPAHEDYGERNKVYARMAPNAEIVRGFWREWLDGKSKGTEALEQIVASVLGAPK